jgi:alanine racemase
MRPAWSEIDLSALTHNVAAIRRMLEPGVRFYAVCKNNAYGCGARETARTMLDAGADAFAVSDPDDVLRIREAGIDVPILLYACTVPNQAAAMARMNVIVTVHDLDGLQALASTGVRCKVHVEVDCGYGRLGFTPEQWPMAFEHLKRATTLHVVGLYTHLATVDDSSAIAARQNSSWPPPPPRAMPGSNDWNRWQRAAGFCSATPTSISARSIPAECSTACSTSHGSVKPTSDR